jgi:hypothetical protein
VRATAAAGEHKQRVLIQPNNAYQQQQEAATALSAEAAIL